MLEHQRQSLMTAKELYPNSTIDELIAIAKKIEETYYKSRPNISLIYFCQSTKIQHPTRGSIDFNLHDYQKQYLTKLSSNKSMISVTARQMGSTQMLSKFALWKAIHNSDHKTCIFSNKFASTDEFRSRINYTLGFINDPNLPAIVRSNKSSILLSNGSEIVFSSISKDMKISANTVIIDNAAYISHSIFDDFWENNNVTLLENNCQIIMNSSANEPLGLFYRLYYNPIKDYNTHSMPWHLHPERDRQWADDTRALIGEVTFDREYNCFFVSRDK